MSCLDSPLADDLCSRDLGLLLGPSLSSGLPGVEHAFHDEGAQVRGTLEEKALPTIAIGKIVVEAAPLAAATPIPPTDTASTP